MFIAWDKDHNRVYSENAVKGVDYFCPCCEEKLILKNGNYVATHFAHKHNTECRDDWHYDMSEWHKRMQDYFDKDCQEIVLKSDGEIHRADVLVDNTVIEFQHSPITVEEFNKRNIFYTSLGYRIVWVFDANEWLDSYQIKPDNAGSLYIDNIFTMYKWNKPPKWLKFGLYNKKNKDVTVCLSQSILVNGVSCDYVFKIDYVNREDGYIWCNKLYTSVVMSKGIDISQFSYTQEDWKNFLIKGINYDIKYCGKTLSQYDDESLICNKSGIGLYEDNENYCDSCEFCLLKERSLHGKAWRAYCGYSHNEKRNKNESLKKLDTEFGWS